MQRTALRAAADPQCRYATEKAYYQPLMHDLDSILELINKQFG